MKFRSSVLPRHAPDIWFLLQSGAGPGAFNMALDEALMGCAIEQGRPILRFYAWSTPAATFGYFQRYSEVAQWTTIRPLIRRPTGGGLVAHLDDWTYSLVLPPNEPWYALKATASYLHLHEWIQAAFANLDVSTLLSPSRQKSTPGQCFIGAEQFDLLWQNRKIAGAAQRRTRNGLLIQGSVQGQPAGVSGVDWQKAMCEIAQTQRGISWLALQPDASLLESARQMEQQKYSQSTYNERR